MESSTLRCRLFLDNFVTPPGGENGEINQRIVVLRSVGEFRSNLQLQSITIACAMQLIIVLIQSQLTHLTHCAHGWFYWFMGMAWVWVW